MTLLRLWICKGDVYSLIKHSAQSSKKLTPGLRIGSVLLVRAAFIHSTVFSCRFFESVNLSKSEKQGNLA